MKSINDPFLRMAFYSILGAVIGVFAGFVIALAVQALLYFVAGSEDYADFIQNGPPVIPFFGMGFGAVIGGILGGVVGIRKRE